MIAVYTRLSKEDEVSNSIENQKKEGKDFVKSLNKKYVLYDEGEGVSGAVELEDRPVLFQLYNDLKTNKLSGVWFRNESRLSRNQRTSILFFDLCIKKDIDVYFNDEKADFKDPHKSLTASILSAINTYQVQLQSNQSKKALENNVKDGKTHSTPPFGYTTNENGYLIIDKKEAKVIKWMFETHLQGFGCPAIAEKLTQKGIKTKKGNDWKHKGVNYVLRNSFYKGKRYWQGKYYDVDAIVSVDLWDKVQNSLTKNINGTGRNTKHKYLLNNIVVCGVCGRNCYGCVKRGVRHVYRCSSKRFKNLNCKNRSINIDNLEDFIWNRFFIDNHFSKLVNDWIKKEERQPRTVQLQSDIKRLEKDLNKVDLKKQKAIKLVLDEVLSENDLKSQLKSLSIQKNDLELKIKRLNESLDFINDSKKRYQDLKKLEVKNVDFDTKQKIIKKYIKEIEILQVHKKRLIKDEKINKYIDEINENYKRKSEHIIFIKFNLPIENEMYITSKKTFYRWNEYFEGGESIRFKKEKMIGNIEILN